MTLTWTLTCDWCKASPAVGLFDYANHRGAAFCLPCAIRFLPDIAVLDAWRWITLDAQAAYEGEAVLRVLAKVGTR